MYAPEKPATVGEVLKYYFNNNEQLLTTANARIQISKWTSLNYRSVVVRAQMRASAAMDNFLLLFNNIWQK